MNPIVLLELLGTFVVVQQLYRIADRFQASEG